MKNLSLLLALLFSVVATAQEKKRAEVYPNTHPELLEGKTVKITTLTGWRKDEGYARFSTDQYGREIYKENSGKTPSEALENRVFKIVSIKPGYLSVFKLESQEGEIIYYTYNANNDDEYYFEVEGGFDLPEGFYCEYFKEGLDDGKKKINKLSKNFWGSTVWLHNNVETDKLEVDLMTSMPTTASKGVTIIFDNGEKLELPNAKLRGKLNNGTREQKDYIYKIATDKEKKLFTENLITTIIYGKEKTPFNSDIPAMDAEKIRGVIACALKTIEERNKQ